MSALLQLIPVTVFDKTLTQVAYIDDYESASFEHAWYQPGKFQMSINFNKSNARLFSSFDVKTNWFYIMWNNNVKRAAKITHVGYSLDEGGKGTQTVNITGEECWGMFKQRLTLPPVTTPPTTNYTRSGTPEYVIKQAISDHAGPTTTDTNRRMSLLSIVANANRYQPGYATASMNVQNTVLLEELKKIAAASFMGIVTYFDLAAKQIMLDIELGLDRSIDNGGVNPVVILSSTYDTTKTAALDIMEDSYLNFAYVRSGGSAGQQVLVGLPAASVPTGEGRYEQFVDGSSFPPDDATLTADLTALGNQALARTVFTSFLGAQPLAYSPYVYGTDYNVGDIVTVQEFDRVQDCRLISMTESVQALTYTLTAQYDKPVPDLGTQVAEAIALTNSGVNNSQALPVFASNANGKWVKLGDGTMIQWGAIPAGTSAAGGPWSASPFNYLASITLPVAFYDTAYTVAGIAGNGFYPWAGYLPAGSKAVGSFTQYIFNNINGAVTAGTYIAIGRWKA